MCVCVYVEFSYMERSWSFIDTHTHTHHRFSLSVEIFDLQSSLLHLYAAIMTNLDPSKGVTAGQIQCMLAPLIPAIQDSATLYDLIFKLMKALHAGERERTDGER